MTRPDIGIVVGVDGDILEFRPALASIHARRGRVWMPCLYPGLGRGVRLLIA